MVPRRRSGRRRLSRAQKVVVALGALVLALGLGNVVRAVVAFAGSAAMPDLPLSVSWIYLAAASAFWAVIFIACGAGLARFRRWGRIATLAAVTAYEAHVWGNHLLFDRSDYALQRRPWDLLFTLLLLAVTWGVLSLRSVRGATQGRGL
jgi:hypothetical protein